MKGKRIEIRISKVEKDILKALAKEKNMTMTDYVLESCLKENSTTVKSEIGYQIMKMQMSNFKIGNNINQIAKRVNSNKNLSKSDFEEFQKTNEQFRNLISEQNRTIKKLLKFYSKW